MKKFPTTIIGSTDKVDLFQYNLADVPCKIDTGADNSTLHCERIDTIIIDDKECVRFSLLDKKHPMFTGELFISNTFTLKRIKSSNGEVEKRYAIQSKIHLFGRDYPIVFTLTNRHKMKYPILLGKKFLKNHFLVDVSQNDLSFKLKRQN